MLRSFHVKCTSFEFDIHQYRKCRINNQEMFYICIYSFIVLQVLWHLFEKCSLALQIFFKLEWRKFWTCAILLAQSKSGCAFGLEWPIGCYDSHYLMYAFIANASAGMLRLRPVSTGYIDTCTWSDYKECCMKVDASCPKLPHVLLYVLCIFCPLLILVLCRHIS